MPSTYMIHGATWGTTKLPGCTGYAIEVGRQTRMMANSGAQFTRLVAAGRYAHAIGLSTRALGTVLGKLGTPATVPVPCANLNGQTLVLAAAGEDDVLPTLSATAELLTVPRGLIALRGLSWSSVGDGVECDLAVLPLSTDGDARPWTPSTGALPDLADDEEEWDVASIAWDGAALVGATGLRMSFDTKPEGMHNPGKIYPTFIRQSPATGPLEIATDITVPMRDLFRTFGEHFAGGALANLVVTAKPFKQAAARDSGVGKTATFTLTGAAEVVQVQDQLPGTVTLRVHGVSGDGTTTPLNWSVS
jgi:hypothetical protein